MNKIQIACLNPEVIRNIEQTLVFAARVTQRAEMLTTLDDVLELFNKPYSDKLLDTFVELPHPTLQKFGVINYVVVGASRRFLAQVTRHQNEVKFMSGSLQYSDYADAAQFCVPYELLERDAKHEGNAEYAEGYHVMQYTNSCLAALADYTRAREQGIDNDTCGYMMPQGMRNLLLISATPYQWKHMIQQRICRRNTPETRYVFLKIWEDLNNMSTLFSSATTLPECCKEGKMSCGTPITNNMTPTELIAKDFPLLREVTV